MLICVLYRVYLVTERKPEFHGRARSPPSPAADIQWLPTTGEPPYIYYIPINLTSIDIDNVVSVL